MAKYFNFFPRVYYTLDDKPTSLKTITNLTTRFAFEEALKNNLAAFYKYDVKDGETPETIAYKFYDSSERHWIVLLFNDVIDPQYDWVLGYEDFNEFVDKKYSAPEYADTANTSVPGLFWAQNVDNVKKYYKIITKFTSNGDSLVEKFEIDENTYNNTLETTIDYTINRETNQLEIIDATGGQTATLTLDSETISNLDICVQQTIQKQRQTYYEYEQELNESKRSIRLLKPEFVPAVESEFKNKVLDAII